MSDNNKWMFKIGEGDIWSSGDRFGTKDEAIKNGKAEVEAENKCCTKEEYFIDHFYVGQIEECKACGVDVDSILDDIANNAYDNAGEAAEDYLNDVTKEHEQELEEKLNDVLFEWMKEHNYEPDFFKIVNVETIQIEGGKVE